MLQQNISIRHAINPRNKVQLAFEIITLIVLELVKQAVSCELIDSIAAFGGGDFTQHEFKVDGV